MHWKILQQKSFLWKQPWRYSIKFNTPLVYLVMYIYYKYNFITFKLIHT